jgi:hypothetical protein
MNQIKSKFSVVVSVAGKFAVLWIVGVVAINGLDSDVVNGITVVGNSDIPRNLVLGGWTMVTSAMSIMSMKWDLKNLATANAQRSKKEESASKKEADALLALLKAVKS